MLNSEIIKINPRIVIKANLKECELYKKKLRILGFISTITRLHKDDCTIKIMHYREPSK